uniref:Uncharacterized protein n=1 Tax=Nocardia terpenica TaxID=455432 RepID=A0A0U1Z264_9NOCA|nr:hypothetical protein [Nocardia terpenica]
MSTPRRLSSSPGYSSAPGYFVRSRCRTAISPRSSAWMRGDIHSGLPRCARGGASALVGSSVGMRTMRQGVGLIISDEDVKKISKYLKSAA